MGNVESRFRDYVASGEHKRAYELYFNRKLLRDSVDPKQICYSDGTSLLHQTARHAMQPLYEEFLDRLSVNPLELTSNGQSCIHLICSQGSDSNIRETMLISTLSHDFVKQKRGILSQCDKDGNTPLHLACSEGLDKCVLVLLEAGANPNTVNKQGHSPIDMATAKGHNQIAEKLETHIVFAPSDKPIVVDMDPVQHEEVPVGMAMKNQEIQSMKDQLIIETSELLGVSLFTAEALLRNHEWSKEALLDSWMNDPRETCENAGVELPSILSIDNIDDHLTRDSSLNARQDAVCSICFDTTTYDVRIPCEHTFCGECWKHYLHDKISNGRVGDIACPQFACYKLVPIHIVEKLVSREMARKYLQFDIKAFVDSNPNIRWCPHPGCGQAVKKPARESLRGSISPMSDEDEDVPKSLFVHCGSDHYFCWSCGEIGHAPCSCKEWSDWLKKIKELSARIGEMSTSEVAEAASSQWVSSNSKPCPNCSAPIQKTEGCNHMRCGKCKHGFCWMCLDKWSKHSSATGGYFQCNRYKQIDKVSEMLKNRQTQNDDFELFSRFKHYYDRYSNHLHSLKIESKYLYSVEKKMAELQRLSGAHSGSVQFVKDAVRQLVEARHTLVASYGYGYFIAITRVLEEFERLQGDFEEHVEALAEVVARPHLRKPKHEIIELTSTVREKQRLFISKVEEGIQPPTPSPPLLFRSGMSEFEQSMRRLRVEREERERREREEEERQLQLAIKASSKDYQTERRLHEDTELAILLSMQDHQISELENQLLSPKYLAKPTFTGSPAEDSGFFRYQSASQNSNNDSSNNLDLDLEKWRQTLLEGNNWQRSSSSNSPSRSNSPLVSPGDQSVNELMEIEEEELRTAIALSLSTVQNNDTEWNDLNVVESFPSNPVLELLNSTNRRPSNV